MSEKIALIGIGVMGETIVKALVDGGFEPSQIFVYDILSSKVERAVENYKVKKIGDIKEIGEHDILVLAVKPRDCKDVLKEIGKVMKRGGAVLSVAAGVTVGKMKEWSGRDDLFFIRSMPNLCARVKESATAVYFERNIPSSTRELSLKILERFGRVYEFEDEKFIDAFTSLGGSSPAVVLTFLKAMEDAGVLMGIPRDKARDITIQVINGVVKLLRETDISPDALKDMVTSPGGTTIEALFSLEKDGFKGIVIQSLLKAFEKATKIGKD